jgi:hypothetical protein
MIRLILGEWGRARAANTDPDFSAFSIAKVAEQCKLGAAENPRWCPELFTNDLPTYLEEDPDPWWVPGEEVEEDDDDNDDNDDNRIIGAYFMSNTCQV